ncbi:MAG: hypothetical protein ACYC18_03380 [Gammaproteobacteria bacterium]
MERMVNTSRRQLALLLEHEIRHPLPEETQEALVTTLADLLLEALGHENPAPADKGGDRDEP